MNGFFCAYKYLIFNFKINVNENFTNKFVIIYVQYM